MKRNKVFWFGFVLGFVIIFGLNYLDAVKELDTLCFDCEIGIGFPFTFYQGGTLLRPTRIIWIGFFADLLFACLAGLAIGIGMVSFRNRFCRSRVL